MPAYKFRSYLGILMSSDQDQQFLTVKEIARFLKLNPLTIYDYIHLKRLPAVKFGRYYRVSKYDLHKFIQSQKVR